MVKFFALLAGIILLISMPLAQEYSKTYVSGGWLQITRTITAGVDGSCPQIPQGVTDVCSNSGAMQTGGAGGAYTQVTLSMKNIGPIDRDSVDVGESLSYVPSGADITFSPSPSQFDGRQAVWQIDRLSRGETKNVTYRFGATVSEAAVGRIPDAAADASPATVVLSAPSSVALNGTLSLSLQTLGGMPVAGANVVVEYPDGSRQGVRTDSGGRASLAATRIGSYTYSVDGYRLNQMVSTVAYVKAESAGDVPSTAASAADTGILPGIIGALPVLAGIFAAAVVVLIIYNFLNSRREEEESHSAPPPLAGSNDEQQGMSYSQKFSFGRSDAQSGSAAMEDTTRSMVESRKRRMQESMASPPQEQSGEDHAPSEEPDAREESAIDEQRLASIGESERTVMNGEMDDELAELEKNARIAGEVAQQEKEVENMLTQLEQIRNKLRAGREGVQSSSGSADEDAPAKRPSPPSRAAPQRKPAAKPKQRGK